jgi:phenylacetate-CoA ligase
MLTVPTTPLDEWTARRIGVDRLTRSAIERWQLEQLREVIAWARERSPLYRRLYGHLPGEALSDLRGLSDLPFVQQSDLRDHGADLVCVSLGDISRVVTVPTSGSTGTPKRVWFTEDDLELTVDHFRHGMRALVQAGERVLVLMPGTTPGSVGSLLREALARDGVEAQSYGFVDSCEQVAKRIEDYGADCLVGVPGQVLRLARSRQGRAIAAGRVKSVLLSGDHVAGPLRAGIEQAWGCHVFEHYGSTETGLGGAVQCWAFAGLHVREADLLFEVVDPGTGEPKADGEQGELVVTTLTRRGMPLIRFRTGDAARMAPGQCRCGSVLRCLEGVEGRLEDVVDLGRGALLTMAELDEAVYAPDWTLGFSAEISGMPSDSQIVIRVEARETPPAGDVEGLARSIEAIPSIRSQKPAVKVEVTEEGKDPPAAAKRRITDARLVAT